MNRLPIQILLVEDNHADVVLIMEAFRTAKAANQINVVRDGGEALEFLRREGKRASAPRPDLILLDLNLPRKNGWQVLADIKSDSRFLQIPVIVLTGSEAEPDVNKAYDLHANCYIVKPMGFEELKVIVTAVEEFWLTIATLPSGGR